MGLGLQLLFIAGLLALKKRWIASIIIIAALILTGSLYVEKKMLRDLHTANLLTLQDFLKLSPDEIYAKSSDAAGQRFTMWKVAISHIAKSPFHANGFGRFSFGEIVRTEKNKNFIIYPHTHNTFIGIAFELGLQGLIVFLWMIITFFVVVWRKWYGSTSGFSHYFTAALLTMMVGYWFANCFENFDADDIKLLFMMLLGIGMAVSHRIPKEKELQNLKPMKKILFIRRDNIGDLICTTPAIHAVREKYPDIKIGILINTYNADVVANNPDTDEVYIYEKAKHTEYKNRFSVWFSNAKLLLKIQKERYDVAIACGNYSPHLARYAFLTGARTRIGYAPRDKKSFYYNLPVDEPKETLHEVVASFKLLEPLGIDGEPSSLVLKPSADEMEKVFTNILGQASRPRYKHSGAGITHHGLIAMHISSRRKENRWGAEKFIELGNKLAKLYNVKPMILWSPGDSKNSYHPGDDETAKEIEEKMETKPFLCRTTRLRELISALSICKLVICLDGGAMHIAAALGKPILTIWGSTDRRRWTPWKAESIILQKGRNADDVCVEEALAGFDELWRKYHEYLKTLTTGGCS